MDKQRNQCRKLMEQIPDEGLSDLESTLREMVSWYDSLKAYIPPIQSPPREVRIILDTRSTVTIICPYCGQPQTYGHTHTAEEMQSRKC